MPSRSPLRRVCVLWPRFGPLHLARLRAADRLFRSRGVELIGLETAGDDRLYDWRVESGPVPFQREKVFPDRLFEDIPPREMHDAVIAALDRLDVDGVGIMSYGYPDARAALAWCRRNRRVAVNLTDSNEHDAARSAWRERVKRTIVAQFDAALVAGTSSRAYLQRLGLDPALIFEGLNVVDNEYFRGEAEHARRHPETVAHLPGLGDESPFFLAVNRFLAIKNLDRLLRAYAAYRRHTAQGNAEPWRLVLLGDGPEREALEAQIRREHIDGVVLGGFRQVEDLPAYYGRAGAFVHPTLKDTWGLVVNEALAAGLPVVVSAVAGCAPDLVLEGETGFTFDPCDTERLTALLEHMASPETDREAMGMRGQQLVQGRYSLEQFAEGLWAAFEAGTQGADRSFNPVAQLLLKTIQMSTRSARSFHTTEV